MSGAPPASDPNALALQRRFKDAAPASAGITVEELAALPSTSGRTQIRCIDYSRGSVTIQDVKDIDAFLAVHRAPDTVVRWINVDGLDDLKPLEALAKKYQLHPLAIEDLLKRPQRPKVDSYGGGAGELQARLFIIARMLRLVNGSLRDEQVSIFLGHSTVITFQELDDGDVWDPIRTHLQKAGSRLRQHDASFLVYALLDAIMDQGFPILEHYGDRLESLEAGILHRPEPKVFRKIHALKREMLLVRRAVWPMREMVNSLQREPHECLSETTRTHLRDVYDRAVHTIEILETYREIAIGLTETYMTQLSNRMNEIMKVLTMISVTFIPITFLSSVFGMNFTNFPWNYSHAFAAFTALCVVVICGMVYWFRRRGWM
ncbi:MAG: magnesium/cobalt transporter CorA [Proteobacteria bacterium]|nr:magnesium/cobalt transporter CorA [Pseudomonadota bacterium]